MEAREAKEALRAIKAKAVVEETEGTTTIREVTPRRPETHRHDPHTEADRIRNTTIRAIRTKVKVKGMAVKVVVLNMAAAAVAVAVNNTIRVARARGTTVSQRLLMAMVDKVVVVAAAAAG